MILASRQATWDIYENNQYGLFELKNILFVAKRQLSPPRNEGQVEYGRRGKNKGALRPC